MLIFASVFFASFLYFEHVYTLMQVCDRVQYLFKVWDKKNETSFNEW